MSLYLLFLTFAVVLAVVGVFVPTNSPIFNRLLAGALAFLAAAFLVVNR